MVYRTSLFSSSKYLRKTFSCKLIFVQIELIENFFTSHVYYIIIFLKIIFVCFLRTKIFLQRGKRITVWISLSSGETSSNHYSWCFSGGICRHDCHFMCACIHTEKAMNKLTSKVYYMSLAVFESRAFVLTQS